MTITSFGPANRIARSAETHPLTWRLREDGEPVWLAEYESKNGYAAARKALAQMSADEIVQSVKDSGLKGRGGAGFPTGVKWGLMPKDESMNIRYLLCNADEMEPNTWKDRMLMEQQPHLLIEGMLISARALKAYRGYIFLRGEYTTAAKNLNRAIDEAKAAGLLGKNVLGSGFDFELFVHTGAGRYICGEETALLESIEGKRGIVRAKPPLPALEGLFGLPTLVHNVLTLASVPIILAKGAPFYRDFGMGRSLGTMPFQLAGNVRHGGLVERAFGLTLRELVEDYGGGTASGRPLKAAQVGGPLGAWVPPSHFDTPLDYEAFAAVGAMLGHGGVVVADDTLNMASMARFALQFCAEESCGKCTPCRIGSTRGMEVVDRLIASDDITERHDHALLLRDLCDTMQYGSLCAMGGMTAYPVASALKYFPADFGLTQAEAAQ